MARSKSEHQSGEKHETNKTSQHPTLRRTDRPLCMAPTYHLTKANHAKVWDAKLLAYGHDIQTMGDIGARVAELPGNSIKTADWVVPGLQETFVCVHCCLRTTGICLGLAQA